MIMETTLEFYPNILSKTEEGRIKLEEWEALMRKYQDSLKWAGKGEQWKK